MKYFEYNLPERAPTYMAAPIRPLYEEASMRVRMRMEVLEKALQLSGLKGEVFSKVVQPYFRMIDDYGDPVLDSMPPEDIANIAQLLASGGIDVPDRMEWPNCSVVVDTAFVTTQEWETLRMLGLGGSDSANVVNEGFTSAQTVYHEKRGTFLGREEEDAGKQFIFDYGHSVEPLVIDEFCRRTGAKRVPESRMFCHKDYPFLTANIDQIVRLANGDLAVFEAKTTTFWNRDHWANGAVPRHYIHQCRKYPLVLNDDRIVRTYIGCIFGNTPSDFACSIVERDKDLEKEQLDREVRFWLDNVVAGVEPPMGGKNAAKLALARQKAGKGNAEADAVILDEDEFGDLLAEYIATEERISALKRQVDAQSEVKDTIAAKIIEAIGDAETAFCAVPEHAAPAAGKKYEYNISYKARGATSVDKERLRLIWPDAYDACVEKKQGNRSFSAKVKRARA